MPSFPYVLNTLNSTAQGHYMVAWTHGTCMTTRYLNHA